MLKWGDWELGGTLRTPPYAAFAGNKPKYEIRLEQICNTALRQNEHSFKMADFARKTKWLKDLEDAKVKYTARYNTTWQARYESCPRALKIDFF